MSGKDPSMEIRRPRPRTLDEFVGTDEGPTAGHVAGPVAPKLAAVPRQTEEAEGTQPQPRQTRRGVAARAKGEALGRLTVYVPLDVAAKLRRYCFDNGLELTSECSRAISEHVARLKL